MRSIDYSEYLSDYGGDTIPADKWKKTEYLARVYVDDITFNRLNDTTAYPIIPNEVILAICAVADVFFLSEATQKNSIANSDVKSFNNDGYSETRATVTEIEKEFDAEKVKAVNKYLPLTHPLRFAGVINVTPKVYEDVKLSSVVEYKIIDGKFYWRLKI